MSPHGAGRPLPAQPAGGVFPTLHERADTALHGRTLGGVLRFATQPDSEVSLDAHPADDRAHGLRVDRRLRDPRGEEPAQILDDEHTGDLLFAELPQPVVLRQIFQDPHGADPFGVPHEPVDRSLSEPVYRLSGGMLKARISHPRNRSSAAKVRRCRPSPSPDRNRGRAGSCRRDSSRRHSVRGAAGP